MMWRKRAQESIDDGDSSQKQTSTRCLLPTDSSSLRSSLRYEIRHGSSDYSGHNIIPSPTGSSGLDSPGSEGLHHRKTHHAGSLSLHPVKQAAAILTNSSTSNASELYHHSLAATMQRSNQRGGIMVAGGHSNINSARTAGRSNHNHHHHHQPGPMRGNRQNIAPSAWKKLAKCAFLVSLLGYALFLYVAQNHYRKKGEQPAYGQHHHDHPLPRKNGKDEDTKQYSQSTLDWKDLQQQQQQQSAHEDRPTLLDVPLSRPLGDMHDYIFKPAPGHKSPKRITLEHSAPQNPLQWSSNNSLQHARMIADQRRKNRRKRTMPPKTIKQSNRIPLWYDMHHSSKDTIRSLQSRWREANDDSTPTAITTTIEPSTLCGEHAQEAAKHHPQNYLLSTKQLGPRSRVLISGILSPLGLHLTIALHRQCGVVNFLGLDTMFPNDPLSRLEYQERLAVLMEELGETVELQVPFLGLESKQSGEQPMLDKVAWTEKLVELRAMYRKNNATTAFVNDAVDLSAPTTRQYAMSFVKYGISPTPGTARDGSGPLNAVLDFRPTHIVHLAGTQSESLLNSNNRGERDDVSRHRSTIFRNKEEEEEDILKESISSRPHLYDLRMGVVGMEQLLSAAVAQILLPPGVGPTLDSVSPDSDLDKSTKPHIVYASTYDALTFRDTATRLRQEEKKKKLEHDNLGSTSLPQPKRPPGNISHFGSSGSHNNSRSCSCGGGGNINNSRFCSCKRGNISHFGSVMQRRTRFAHFVKIIIE